MRSHTRRGMGIGFLVGAGSGVLLGLASGDYAYATTGQLAVTGGLVFGVLGAAIGAMVGSVPTDSWVDVPARRVNVGLFPTRSGGAGMAVTVSF
jgi:hypothetical protein